MSATVGGTIRAKNTVVGLLTLPLLLTGGGSLYKTVHLWSALTAAPLLTHHLVRHLRRVRLGARHTLHNADPMAAHGVRRWLLLVGDAGTTAWAVTRLLGRAGETAASSGPNDFPVTITTAGCDQPDPHSWRLEVDGDVVRPRTFTLAELRGIGMEGHRYSLGCILGCSVVREWAGVPLEDVLQRCAPTGTLLSADFQSTTGYEAALLADRRPMVALERLTVELTLPTLDQSWHLALPMWRERSYVATNGGGVYSIRRCTAMTHPLASLHRTLRTAEPVVLGFLALVCLVLPTHVSRA